MVYAARYQPQNPELSHYALGWTSCTAFAGAMAGDFDSQGSKYPTGAAVRRLTGDVTGGLTLAQVTMALQRGWNVSLDIRYRMTWATFARKLDAGHGAVLQGHGIVFNGTPFYAGAPVNHAIFVPPDRRALDPAADGRRDGIYDARTRKVYPDTLLRKFAGRLILDMSTRRQLGDGLVYAAFTRDVTTNYYLRFKADIPFWVYTVAGYGIVSRRTVTFGASTSAPSGAPGYVPWPGRTGRVLVPVLKGALAGEHVAIPQTAVTLVEKAP